MADKKYNIEMVIGARNKASKTIKNLSRGVAALGAATGAAMAASVKAAADFDEAMTQSTAIMDTTTQQEEEMAARARDLATTTTKSHNEIAQSYFYLASAGMDATESMENLDEVVRFAEAGQFDMQEATDLLTDSVSALGKEYSEMTNVGDKLVKANQMANASVEQFATSMTQRAGSAIKNFNISLDEGVAVLARFADTGLKGRRAGRIFSRTIEGLTKRARENSEAFEKLGIDVIDESTGNMRNISDVTRDLTQALGDMSDKERSAAFEQLGFNRRVSDGIRRLMGGADALDEYQKGLADAGGATEEVAKKQRQTFNKQLGITKDILTDVGITIGNELLPPLQDLIKNFRDWSEEGDNVETATKDIMVVMKGLLSTIAGVGAAAEITWETLKSVVSIAKDLPKSTGLGMVDAVRSAKAISDNYGDIKDDAGDIANSVQKWDDRLSGIANMGLDFGEEGGSGETGPGPSKEEVNKQKKRTQNIKQFEKQALNELSQYRNQKRQQMRQKQMEEAQRELEASRRQKEREKNALDELAAYRKQKDKQTAQTAKRWHGVIANSMEGSIADMLKGQRTFKEGMEDMWESLADAVIDEIARMTAKLVAFKTIETGLNIVSPGAGSAFTELMGFSQGVRNFQGGMALVGEEGPELVNLPRGTDVLSNSKTESLSGGGSPIGGMTLVVKNNTFAGQGGLDEFVQVVKDNIYDDIKMEKSFA